MQRIALDETAEPVDLVETILPLTETLPRVLLEIPARELDLGAVQTNVMIGGRIPLAAYAGFDFALRCVAAIMLDPLGDQRAAFRAAAQASSAVLGDDFSPWSEGRAPRISGSQPSNRSVPDPDADDAPGRR